MKNSPQYTFVIDLDRCIGCRGCQVACKMENETPLGANRTIVRQVGPFGSYPNLQMYFLPVPCQQCEDPLCLRACPTGAIYKRESDGVIMLDTDKCIGCRRCNAECPYHANTYSTLQKHMDKCTICAQLREKGEKPACVRNCPGSALHFGDINDPDSEVSRMLQEAGEENVYSLRDFGNHPAARYILRNNDWQDVIPYELDEVAYGRGGRMHA